MPNFRCSYIPGGTFFFTVVTYRRVPFLKDTLARQLLREAIHSCQARWPFSIEAMVLLPDHLHTIWTLPSEDFDYSKRWGWIKKEFTKQWLKCGYVEPTSFEGHQGRRRGVWQARFWEHTLRGEFDLERHMDYIHYNPVKHGLVRCPQDWPWSSFHRWVRCGIYPKDWGCLKEEESELDFSDIENSISE